MEMGNMIFGNSRGEHPVDRDLQDRFCLLLEELGCDRYGNMEREHKDFVVRPYFWGDCECGWEALDPNLRHRDACYQAKLASLRISTKTETGLDEPYASSRTALCEAMGLDPLYGSEVHCTCDYPQRFEDWFSAHKLGAEGHRDDCPIVLPNFEHRPSGFRLKWYKYPLRDSYSNKPLTAKMIREWTKAVLSSGVSDGK